MDQIITDVLTYFQKSDIDFDVYVIADTQERTKYLDDLPCLHADESEFFSKKEFAEIASAIFNVFGYVRVFYSEMEFIEYFVQNKLNTNEFIVYNFARDGQINGKKSLIPAFCDLFNVCYTGSNAFVISLLRNKDVYTSLLDINGIPIPSSMVYRASDNCKNIISKFKNKKVIAKNLHESASIGLNKENVFVINEDLEEKLLKLTIQMGSDSLFMQEFIDGNEYEVLVLQFKGKYYALEPIEIVFPSSQTYIDSKLSNSYQYRFQLPTELENTSIIRLTAEKAASILNIKDYARFDFRIKDGIPYLFDIAGTPYTIYHSSIAYLFTHFYNL